MRLLIYGFGPYRGFHENITEKIVRKFPKRRWMKKLIFAVRFNRSQFISAVKNHKPDVILGLGQCSKGRLLRIESTAVNKKRNNKTEKAKPILQAGSPRLVTNLKLNLGQQSRSSDDAGDYVCNYSMYVILDFIKCDRLPIRYGFIHVPHRYDSRKATRIFLKAIEQISSTTQKR
jgi:pyroglutamyl-peptidase